MNAFGYLKPVFIFFTALLLIHVAICSQGQEVQKEIKTDEIDIIDKIETISENTDAVLDYTNLISELKYFRENPINLNYATEEDLRKLVFLDVKQIYNLLAYRETYGYFLTIYEIQAIEAFNAETINKLLPYVYVSQVKSNKPINLKGIGKYGRHELVVRYQRNLQKQKGYFPISDSALYSSPNSRYLGSPDKVYTRYAFNYFNRVRWGITAEKDAGEVFLKDHVNDSLQTLLDPKLKNGFDFYSVFLSLHDIGMLKTLTLGDYQLDFGQGLTLGTGLAFGKSVTSIDVKRFARGVRPSTSANENLFFRGAATTLRFNKLNVSAFYSSHKVDATLIAPDTLDNEETYISSLQESGLHRTPNELLKKHAINTTAIGGNMSLRFSRFKIGLTSYYSKLGRDLNPDSQLYNQFRFRGTENINTGIDYSFLLKGFSFFGEISMSKNGGFAQIHGMTAFLHSRLTMTLLYRNYQKEYQNFFSNAFAEGSENANEKGLYTGIRLAVYRKWIVTAYMDMFSFPWLKYRTDAPSDGNEFQVQIENNVADQLFLYFRFRQQNRQINAVSSESLMDPLSNTRKNNYRFFIEYRISPSIVFKNRLEYITYRESSEYKGNGYLVYQDILWRPLSWRLSLVLRYALFDTDSYDERLFAYENDVMYAFTIPAYYYKGSRSFLLVQYKLSTKMQFWFRIGHTFASNQQTIGTGLEEIDGNTKTEVKLQLRLKL